MPSKQEERIPRLKRLKTEAARKKIKITKINQDSDSDSDGSTDRTSFRFWKEEMPNDDMNPREIAKIYAKNVSF